MPVSGKPEPRTLRGRVLSKKGRSAVDAEFRTVLRRALPRTVRGRLVVSVQSMNSQVIAAHDNDRSGRALPGMPFFVLLSRLERSGGLFWPRLEASPRIQKVDGRRTEGVGDARKVIGRCLPAASRHREFRAPADKRLKSTSQGVPATVGRWAAGTEGGAKAPACDGKANFI